MRVGVRVSTVSQNRVVDQRWVVEALHIELGSVLRRSGEKGGRKRERKYINKTSLLMMSLKGSYIIYFCNFLLRVRTLNPVVRLTHTVEITQSNVRI